MIHCHIGGLSKKDFRKCQIIDHINSVGWNSTVYVNGELMARDGHLWT